MEVPYKSFQKEKKWLDKWVKGAKRKTGGAHLLEEGRLKPDQGSQCLTRVTCKFRTLSKNLAEEGKWDTVFTEKPQEEAESRNRFVHSQRW